MSSPEVTRPRRLHHHAYVVADQERTRQFYEEILGLPLVATWCEVGDEGEYCHTFYELADGSCLAFFQFADPEIQATNTAPAVSVYDHVALDATAELQAAVVARADAAGALHLTIDHGYCTSLYLPDPDGLLIELTLDNPEALDSSAERRARAHGELARWLAGDHSDNNAFRH